MVWREYTRETAPRRGWAFGGMAATMGIALALAGWQVRTKEPAEAVSGRQAPPDWPITFELPDGYRWRVESPPRVSVTGRGTRMGGSVLYRGDSLYGGQAGVSLRFHQRDSGPVEYPTGEEFLDADDVESRDDDGIFVDGIVINQPIDIGDREGVVTGVIADDGSQHMTAQTRGDDGLEVAIVYFQSGRGASKDAMEALCRSVRFVEKSRPE